MVEAIEDVVTRLPANSPLSPTSKPSTYSASPPSISRNLATQSLTSYIYIGEEQLIRSPRHPAVRGELGRVRTVAMAAKSVGAAGLHGAVARTKAKEAAVGAVARVLFYPTLLYNVVRSKVQAEFRWWDEVDQFILLGAVPFRRDVPRLKKLGVYCVITLNEPFENLVPSSMYQSHGIDHLVIPTRDYMFAPSLVDISQAVDFIHRNTSRGRMTYIHCKAGRGRSTTIVLCYLVKHKHMIPTAAFEYVRSKRARVLLTHSQWRVVQEFSKKDAELRAVTSHSAAASP